MCAIEVPAAPRGPDTGVRLFAFTVGYVHMPLSFFLAGEPGEVKVPVTAYLIDHPKDLVLFDTGLGARFVRPKGAVRESFIDIEQGSAIEDRLRAIHVDPNDIHWIIASHFHTDHAGGNAQFPNATIIVQKQEYEFAKNNADGKLYCLEEFETGQPLKKLCGEYDLFNDGTVVVFPTPGHTPGHQSVRIRTCSGEVVLTGDCCNMRRSLDEYRLPEYCHNADRALESLKLLSRMEKGGARIFPSHDPVFWEKIKKNTPIT